MNYDDTYLPVNPEVGYEICQRFRKDGVLIMAVDNRFSRLHFTSAATEDRARALIQAVGGIMTMVIEDADESGDPTVFLESMSGASSATAILNTLQAENRRLQEQRDKAVAVLKQIQDSVLGELAKRKAQEAGS